MKSSIFMISGSGNHYKVIINKKQEIVKLPNGVSRAYINKRDDGELTRIDFPHATYKQYWQVVSLSFVIT